MSRLRVVDVLNRIVVIVDVVDHLIGVVVVSLVRGDRDHGFLVGGLRRCRLRRRTPPVRSRSFHFGLGAALGASDRISMQVVKFPAATHTRVLGAPFPALPRPCLPASWDYRDRRQCQFGAPLSKSNFRSNLRRLTLPTAVLETGRVRRHAHATRAPRGLRRRARAVPPDLVGCRSLERNSAPCPATNPSLTACSCLARSRWARPASAGFWRARTWRRRRLRSVPLGRSSNGRVTASWRVHGVGVGGLAEPDAALDLGNSGTAVRLLAGVCASHGFTTFMIGDRSLRRRPMRRIIEPLERMGAAVCGTQRRPVAVRADRR